MRVGKGGTLDKMDKALSRERALSQLSDKVVLNVLLPHVRVGAYKHPHKRVRIARRRPVISRLRERLDIRGGGTILTSAPCAGGDDAYDSVGHGRCPLGMRLRCLGACT